MLSQVSVPEKKSKRSPLEIAMSGASFLDTALSISDKIKGMSGSQLDAGVKSPLALYEEYHKNKTKKGSLAGIVP